MQVNVFISEVTQDGAPTAMLVLPSGPEAAIPPHLQHVDWRYFATVDSKDEIICRATGDVDTALAADGFALTTPATGRGED